MAQQTTHAADAPQAVAQPAPPVVDNKQKKRYQIIANLTPEEFEYVNTVINARITNGFTRDSNHFVRQCIDFAVNNGFVAGRPEFGVPDDLEPKLLKDAFFSRLVKNIPVCK